MYHRLASDELFRKYPLGKTQNSNKSLDRVTWQKCRKYIFSKLSESAASLKLTEDAKDTKFSSISMKHSQQRYLQSLQFSRKSAKKTISNSGRSNLLRIKAIKERKKENKEGLMYEAGCFSFVYRHDLGKW